MAHRARLGRRHRGFTLIELMIVVTIIGLLASVAIPEFMRMSMRTKKSEREIMTNAILRTLNDYWLLHGKLPGGLVADLPQNPPQPPDGSKQAFLPTVGKWQELSWRPDGLLYFRYDVTGMVTGTTGVLFVTSKADLDRNGVPTIKTIKFTLEEGTWQWNAEIESAEKY